MSQLSYTPASDTNREPSPIIWHDFPHDEVREDAVGLEFWDDFRGGVGAVSSKIGGWNDWETYEDTNTTILVLEGTSAATKGGIVRLSLPASSGDNLECAMQAAAGSGGPFFIGNTAGAAFPLWFEIRYRISTVTNGKCGAFMGLAQGNSPANNFMGDGGGLADFADADYIGFFRDEDDGDAIDVIHNIAGGTDTTLISDADTLAANTWYKAGFKYLPLNGAAKQITFYFDGVAATTYATTTTINTAGTFPENQGLSPIIAFKNAADAAATLDIDWVRCAQVYRLAP
jgi:hypothetical protein